MEHLYLEVRSSLQALIDKEDDNVRPSLSAALAAIEHAQRRSRSRELPSIVEVDFYEQEDT